MSRPDRDRYVNIHFKNIKDRILSNLLLITELIKVFASNIGNVHNFKKADAEKYQVLTPYDFCEYSTVLLSRMNLNTRLND